MKVVLVEHRKHNQEMIVKYLDYLHVFCKVLMGTQDGNIHYTYEMSGFIIRNYDRMSVSDHLDR